MAAREQNGRAVRSYAERTVESPFLEEKLLAEEPEAEREADSPFREAFERDRASLSEPEEEEFVEEDEETLEESSPDYLGKLPREAQLPEAEPADVEEKPLTIEVERDHREDDEAHAEPHLETDGLQTVISGHQPSIGELTDREAAWLDEESEQVAAELERIGGHLNLWGDPQVELQLGTLLPRLGGIFELGPPSAAADPSVAVPPFNFLKRLLLPVPVLDATRSANAIRWNQAQHPRVSGVDPNDIRIDLARYVNLTSVQAGINNFNQKQTNPSTRIGLGRPPIDAIFVEAVHQFQAKCFFEQKQIDGRAGGSTLDSLGLVKRKGLNPANQPNTGAIQRLRTVDVSAATRAEFTADNWFDFMVNPSFLGWRFTTGGAVRGVHLFFMRTLRIAEKALLAQPKYRGATPVELGRALGFDDKSEEHRGARPDQPTKTSMHTYGLAVDIKYSQNPWVRGPEFTTALKRAALLISGVQITQTTSQQFFHSLGSDSNLTTELVFRTLSERDRDFRRYLGLDNNSTEIENVLNQRRADRTPGVFVSSTETVAQARRRWQVIISNDRDNMRAENSPFRTNGGLREPIKGFLNLNQDLVVALRDKACLAWGAVDIGPRSEGSGDIMHFDARVCGLGDQLASRWNFPITSGHPCLPCAAEVATAPGATKELEAEEEEEEEFAAEDEWAGADNFVVEGAEAQDDEELAELQDSIVQLDGTAGEAEYLDDEERDASESSGQNAQQEHFEAEDEAAAGSTVRLPAPLSAQQRAWVLALERSALERLPDAAERARFVQQDWSDVEFPGNVPRGQSATDEIKRHWVLARSLFNAMAGVTPERRVPTTIRFRDRPAVKVPGQPSQRLFAEARDAFVRMHAAAKADGVDLVILSSWRSRARQAAASANQPNPAAVARKASAHMYGLAIDLRMGVPGLPVKEINTRVDRATAAKAGTAAKMGNLVRMYRSPVYKWMSLRAREFGWYPYRNEPWHWEYNPPGLKARFEGATRGELEQEAQAGGSVASWEQADEGSLYSEAEYEDEGAAPSPFLRTFTAKALGVKVAVYVTQAARNVRQVEMMVFAHGLDLCKPVFKNRPATFITERPFTLGELVEATGRPIVLVVPFLDWERLDANRMAFGRKWHRLAQPANFNQVAAEALEQVRAMTGSAAPPTVHRLILAGHSRAYGFFDALAHEHASPQMRTGALASPTHVWALDTTYSAPIADWRAWLCAREDLQATVVYRQGTYRTKGSVVRELATGVRGKEFIKLAAASNGRLTVMPVAAGNVSHCGIPTAYLPRLLAALPALATSGEHEAEAQYEEFEEGEDYAGITTEAEALASEDEATRGEWTEQPANEEELDAPDRFDAFGDERDSEWDAQSSEEEQWQEGSFEDSEHNLSFALDQENEAGLAGSGLTPAEQKAVEITSLFETGKRGGFYGLSGNFDGQGLSFGLVNWTIGTGSLQPLLRDFAREHPARWVWVFGSDASRFLQLIAGKDKQARKEQHRFAVEQMNSVSTGARGKRIWTVRQPWVGYFRRLSEDPAFQKIQVRYVRDLLACAGDYCRQFRLTSEQAFCFMFDAVASHGKWWLKKKFSGVEKRRVLIEQALKALATRFGTGRVPENEVLLAIADVLAATSAQRWADKVRRRKRWFVTGQHPRGRELDGLKPRADVAYSTSISSSRERESDEADIAGESEMADDAQAILGRWIVRVKDWVWEYEFSPGGKLAWRDTRSNEKGVGRWSIAPKAINISWSGSATTETWLRPLTLARQKGWFKSSYYTGNSEAQKVFGSAPGGATDVGGPGISIPPGGLTININTAEEELDLGRIRMTKRHLFVEANIHIEPTTPDADQPSSYGLTPSIGTGGASDRPPQPGQSGKVPTAKMRWHNLGPSTYRWRFSRGPSPTRPDWTLPPVRSSLVGNLIFTESDTWPGE